MIIVIIIVFVVVSLKFNGIEVLNTFVRRFVCFVYKSSYQLESSNSNMYVFMK